MNSADPRSAPPQAAPQCIIMLTVGNGGSTIVAGLFSLLGWQLPDNDPEYNEPRWLRSLNHELLRGEHIKFKDIEAEIAALPRPWLLKDPRFCETLPALLPVFEPYQPLLLFLERDRAAVEASWRRRPGQSIQVLKRRLAAAESHFQLWPWAKTRVRFEDIAAWGASIDVSRALGN